VRTTTSSTSRRDRSCERLLRLLPSVTVRGYDYFVYFRRDRSWRGRLWHLCWVGLQRRAGQPVSVLLQPLGRVHPNVARSEASAAPKRQPGNSSRPCWPSSISPHPRQSSTPPRRHPPLRGPLPAQVLLSGLRLTHGCPQLLGLGPPASTTKKGLRHGISSLLLPLLAP
jgi:hypothetical protein